MTFFLDYIISLVVLAAQIVYKLMKENPDKLSRSLEKNMFVKCLGTIFEEIESREVRQIISAFSLVEKTDLNTSACGRFSGLSVNIIVRSFFSTVDGTCIRY